MSKNKWTNPGKYTPCNIGGQALLEGVMMRGRTSAALCCRDEKGELAVATERTPPRTAWYYRIPFVRGVTSFLYSLVGGVKYIGKSAEIYAGDDEDAQLGKGGMAVAVVLAVVLAVGLFAALPALLNWLVLDLALDLSSRVDDNIYMLLMCLFKGVIKVAILVLYLFLTSRLKDIRRTYMYHGAEHRTINCYEHNLELTVENVQKCSTRHARCGTTFSVLHRAAQRVRRYFGYLGAVAVRLHSHQHAVARRRNAGADSVQRHLHGRGHTVHTRHRRNKLRTA